MNPRFSIVVPSLNQGQFLEQALVSLFNQGGDVFEVIVVDGASTDDSVAVIEKYADRLAWWCSEPDRGQSAALNKGFARARGEYLFWVNADDLLLPGTLDLIRAYLRKNPGCEWLAGNLVYIDQQDKVLWCARDGQWHDWLYRHAPVRVYGPSSVFKKRLFNSVGGFDESLHYVMDTDLWLRFKKAGARFVRLPHYFWGFRVHEGSKTSGDLMGKKPAEMAAEQARMYLKNGLKVTQLGLWSQRLWRVVNGCYARAWWDTRARAGQSLGHTPPPPGRGSP